MAAAKAHRADRKLLYKKSIKFLRVILPEELPDWVKETVTVKTYDGLWVLKHLWQEAG